MPSGLWTAIDITGLFVRAQVLVQVSELAAGAVLGAFAGSEDAGGRRHATRRTIATVLGLVAHGDRDPERPRDVVRGPEATSTAQPS